MEVYHNEFGIREVKEEEIEVLGYLGRGKKGSTRKAKWDGRIIALKSWYENSSYLWFVGAVRLFVGMVDG